MKYIVLVTVYIWVALILTIAKAHAFPSDELIHPVAHGAGSYMLTHVSEVVCVKVSDASKLTCSIVGGMIATTVGIAIEASQKESGKLHANSYIENGAGVLLAIGVINLDF